jgi:DNA-binding SARP family transcriptional activator
LNISPEFGLLDHAKALATVMQAMLVRISLTGRLTVETDRRTQDATRLRGRQGRVLLAYLAAEHGRPVPSEQLAEALWGLTLPPTWRPALRGVVSDVRDFLEALDLPADGMLTSSSGSYLLTLPDDASVDVELAAREAERAEQALAAGDLEQALAAATAAREIADRPLLPDLEGLWLDRHRAALQGVLTRSLEVLIDAHLASGRGDLAVRPATKLVGLEPFRESAHLRLLSANAAAGDRAEALRAYERCRRLLAEELGVDPSPQLEAAYLDLLRAEPVARPDQQPASVEQAATAAVAPTASLFVGRDPELERLRAAWADARASQRRLVVVAGEAGIGKSRLAAELAGLAEREGATVLFGRCDERPGVSYLPVRAALGRYLTAYPPDRLQALIGPHGGELVRLWPELARRLPDLPGPTRGTPEAEHYLLFQAVTGLLDAIAANGPILLVIDDLHLADEPSLSLLRHLVHAALPGALLLLAVYRDDEEPRADLTGALADLGRVPGVEQLKLAGLAWNEVATIAAAAVGRPLGPGGPVLARVLRERTGGNPFFVEELLRHLAETAALAGADIAQAVSGPAAGEVPNSIRLILGKRLARLGGAVEQVLDLVAVIGHEADLAVLARAIDLGYDDLVCAVDAAVRARLLEEQPSVPGRYAFRHAIVHDHIYGALPTERRALLHHRAGKALERLGGGTARLGELADHFTLGPDSDAAKAAGYARRAGDQAFEQLLYEEAADRYRQALAALDRATPHDHLRCDLLLGLGDALTQAGQASRANEAYLQATAAARAASSVDRLARAALGLGGSVAFWSVELDHATAIAQLRAALAAIGGRDSTQRALLLARLAGWETVLALVRPGEGTALPSFSQAMTLARRLGDPKTLAAVLGDRALAMGSMILGRPGGPGEDLNASAELDRLAGEVGDDRLAYQASWAHLQALLFAGDLDGVDRLIEREERAARARRVPYLGLLPLVQRTLRTVMRGDFTAGEQLAGQMLANSQGPVGSLAVATHDTQLVFLRWLQGRPAEVQALLERLIRQWPLLPGWSHLLPLAYGGLGRAEEARRDLDATAARGFADRRVAGDVVAVVGACAMLGDADRAARLYQLLLPWASWHLTNFSVYLGAADHHLGILAATAGRWDDAERHLRTALAAHRRLGARPWQALTTQAYAGMLRGRGRLADHKRAAQFDATASATAATLGMDLPGWGRSTLDPLT